MWMNTGIPMMLELLEDRPKGRLEGPFQAPTDWPPAGETLQPLPDECIYAAMCFSVSQHNKIRRCEDYRRS